MSDTWRPFQGIDLNELRDGVDDTTVYVVTSGMFEDYGIDGIFDDLAQAEDYVKRHNALAPAVGDLDDYWVAHVETWTLNTVAQRHQWGVNDE